MPSGPSSVAKQSALLCNSWLRKSCACSQMLHYSPAAGLPHSLPGLWCGTLGFDRHGLSFLKSLKNGCPFVLLFSTTRCYRTYREHTDLGCPTLFGGNLIAAVPFSPFSFTSLRTPAVASWVSPRLSLPSCPSKPQSPKRQWASALRMKCGQRGTGFSQHNIIWSSALLLAWPGFGMLPKVLKSSRCAPPHHCESEAILSSTWPAWEHLWCWCLSRSKPPGAIGSYPWRSLAGKLRRCAYRKGIQISPYHCHDSALEEWAWVLAPVEVTELLAVSLPVPRAAPHPGSTIGLLSTKNFISY